MIRGEEENVSLLGPRRREGHRSLPGCAWTSPWQHDAGTERQEDDDATLLHNSDTKRGAKGRKRRTEECVAFGIGLPPLPSFSWSSTGLLWLIFPTAACCVAQMELPSLAQQLAQVQPAGAPNMPTRLKAVALPTPPGRPRRWPITQPMSDQGINQFGPIRHYSRD